MSVAALSESAVSCLLVAEKPCSDSRESVTLGDAFSETIDAVTSRAIERDAEPAVVSAVIASISRVELSTICPLAFSLVATLTED